MKFYLADEKELSKNFESYPCCILLRNGWNDWGYLTTFNLLYYSKPDEKPFPFGSVKIAQKNMPRPTTFQETLVTKIAKNFEYLDKSYFSLGNSSDYYLQMFKFGQSHKSEQQEILNALQDIVNDSKIYQDNKDEAALSASLMRTTSQKTINDVYSKSLTTGHEDLTPYHFSIELKNEINNTKMEFAVSPHKLPQSNIHTLIGRNGVGKTHLFKNIIAFLLKSDSIDSTGVSNFIGKENISSVLALSYSIFDTTLPKKDKSGEIPYRYIGFPEDSNLQEQNGEKKYHNSLTPNEFIINEFLTAVKYIKNHNFLNDLVEECITTLNSDPIFNSLDVIHWLAETDESVLKHNYRRLSSGHKIVLLSLFKIIINIEPNSLFLIDEPEQNLHPPLISSFIQAILVVLNNRNAVALIATHSPVVVQECTAESTWILDRSGRQVKVSRPQINTFGENVGKITYDVFDLEVDKSGYMKVIDDVLNRHKDLDEDGINGLFQNKLGDESLRRIASLLYQRESDDMHE